MPKMLSRQSAVSNCQTFSKVRERGPYAYNKKTWGFSSGFALSFLIIVHYTIGKTPFFD